MLEKKVLDLLLEKNKINKEKHKELKTALDNSDVDLDKLIIKQKLLDEEKLTELKAEVYNLPYKNLLSVEIPEGTLKFISKDIAQNYGVICFEKNEKKIKVGIVEPKLKSMEAINFLAKEGNLKAEFYLISKTSFKRSFGQYEKMEEEISSALKAKGQKEGEEEVIEMEDDDTSLDDENINTAPVAKIVAVIIRHAVEEKASDIHIEPFENESRVRYRIDGILHTSLSLPKNIHTSVVARIKVMAKLKLDETRIPQDGRIRLLINQRKVDFRISTLPVGKHEKVVMRILDTQNSSPTLEDLGFNKYTLRVLEKNVKKTSGILLVTGPTGSGKSTTLYSLLHILNQEGVNIMTLEDPVEYQIKGVNQSQVKPSIGYDFASGLRSFLRQDPDIIMVGEIRDEETAELAVHAGLTGHFVLSTLHTNDAFSSVFRLMDMNVEPFLLASTLRVILAQRLARRLCSHCKQEMDIPQTSLEKFKETLRNVSDKVFKEELPHIDTVEELEKFKVYKPVGCTRCNNTGFSSRVAIGEVIEITEKLRDKIGEDPNSITLDMVKKNQPFVSIRQDGFIKVLKGLTSIDEVLRIMQV